MPSNWLAVDLLAPPTWTAISAILWDIVPLALLAGVVTGWLRNSL